MSKSEKLYREKIEPCQRVAALETFGLVALQKSYNFFTPPPPD